MCWDTIEQFYYINLRHQTTRKKKFLQTIKQQKIPLNKVTRIEGVHNLLNGYKGALLSHLEAVNQAIEQGYGPICIFEDDIHFIGDYQCSVNYLAPFFKDLSWDVVFLGAKVAEFKDTAHPDIKHVLHAAQSHAYIVAKHYLPLLQEFLVWNYENVMKKEVFFTQSTEHYSYFDNMWQYLQKMGVWLIKDNILVRQNISMSNNTLTCCNILLPENIREHMQFETPETLKKEQFPTHWSI